MKGRVLVTSACSRVAYCICRNLRRHGLHVVAADPDPLAMSFWSRFVSGRHICASPFRDEGAFIADVLRIIEKEKIDVLIPVLEETYFVSRNRSAFSSHVRTLVPDYRGILALHDKRSLLDVAARFGVSTPRTAELADALDGRLPDGFRYPAVLKPKQGGGGGAIVRISDAGHLRRHVRAARLNAGAYLVQEKIDAEMANVAMLYDGGKLVAGDTYQTLAVHPHPFGQSTLRVSREYPRARDALKTMLDALQWNGPCQADFLYDRSRDETFLIDVNPRFWGSVEQSIARGIEFPYYYYRCAMGLGGFAAPSSPPVVATKWLGGDLMRRIVGLTSRSASGGAAQDGLPRRVEGMDDFYGTDPLPFVGWGVSQIVRRVRRLAGGKVSRESLDGIWE